MYYMADGAHKIIFQIGQHREINVSQSVFIRFKIFLNTANPIFQRKRIRFTKPFIMFITLT